MCHKLGGVFHLHLKCPEFFESQKLITKRISCRSLCIDILVSGKMHSQRITWYFCVRPLPTGTQSRTFKWQMVVKACFVVHTAASRIWGWVQAASVYLLHAQHEIPEKCVYILYKSYGPLKYFYSGYENSDHGDGGYGTGQPAKKHCRCDDAVWTALTQQFIHQICTHFLIGPPLPPPSLSSLPSVSVSWPPQTHTRRHTPSTQRISFFRHFSLSSIFTIKFFVSSFFILQVVDCCVLVCLPKCALISHTHTAYTNTKCSVSNIHFYP